jgi:hypothetical protein
MASEPQPKSNNIWARFVRRVRRWAGPAELTAEDLKLARHSKFCVAIPFPHLTWKDGLDPETQLAHLHDYVVQLANSALDWYLKKKHRKKIFAKFLHYATYISAGLAAIIPLSVLVAPVFEIISKHIGDYREVAAEAALGGFAAAGGFAIIDRVSGCTADWMRYMMTATDLNRALVEFHFQWNELTHAAERGQKSSAPTADKSTKCGADQHTDWIKKRIDLAQSFALKILDLIAGETQSWAKEQKERSDRMATLGRS